MLGPMRVTKHEHACLVLDKAEQKLVIDPGAFTTPLIGMDNVAAIVITHEHPDHWTPEHLGRILERNQEAVIFSTPAVAAAASDFSIITVADGDHHEVGGFSLRFFGDKHAVIHPSIPLIDNIGVMVDDALFYPGDSYTVPPVAVDTLVAPAGGPWLKISEAMDYVTAVAPKRCLPTHQMGLSKIGQKQANDRLREVTEAAGGEYLVLEPDESLHL